MGIAAYNRGSKAITDQIAREHYRPTAFLVMDRINALPKFQAKPMRPFTEKVVIESDPQRENVWWVMCPVKLENGFSYWYRSLAEAVRSWDVYLTGYDETTNRWTAEVAG